MFSPIFHLYFLDGSDKIAVLGNHDQGEGRATELHLVSELENAGIRVLRNSSIKLSRGLADLYVAGTDDYRFSCDLEKALSRVPPNEFKILLCHSPDVRMGIKHGLEKYNSDTATTLSKCLRK